MIELVVSAPPLLSCSWNEYRERHLKSSSEAISRGDCRIGHQLELISEVLVPEIERLVGWPIKGRPAIGSRVLHVNACVSKTLTAALT